MNITVFSTLELPAKYEGKQTITLPVRTEADSNCEGDPFTDLVRESNKTQGFRLIFRNDFYKKDPLIPAAKSRLTGKDVIQCSYDELDIRVARDYVSRALRFFDTLINLLRTRSRPLIIKNGSAFALIRGGELLPNFHKLGVIRSNQEITHFHYQIVYATARLVYN